MTTHRRAVKIEGTGNEHEDRCIGGGISTERAVSLVTGTGVCRALRKTAIGPSWWICSWGWREVPADLETLFDAPDGLCPDAKIEVEAPDLETVKRGRKDQGPSHIGPHVLDICQKADLVFLGLHGMDGEDGRIQAALDLLGVPYTGAGHLASAVAMDKAVSKQILDACGIPTPKWRPLSYGLDEAEPLAQTPPMPCVIKTIEGGSSLGVYLPEDRTELEAGPEEVPRYGAKVLAEERIYGRELTVAVLGTAGCRRWRPCPPERNLTTWPSTRPARRWRPVRPMCRPR